MAFTTGSAANHHDLLDKLRIWLTTTVGWTQVSWTPGSTLTDNYYLIVQGPGAGAGREVYATFYAQGSSIAPYYSISCSAAIGYQAGAAWGTNPGESPPCYLNLWENAISYWFYANDRRIIIVAKCSTSYMSAYVGMFLPWASPTQFPFPLYVGADYPTHVYYSYSNSARRMFCDPGVVGSTFAGVVRDLNGQWNGVQNQGASTNNDSNIGYSRGSSYFVWPASSGSETSGDFNGWGAPGGNYGSASGSGTMDKLVPTAQGERIVIPMKILHTDTPELGVLDGVYAPLSSGIASEQVVTAGGLTLRAFQNIGRNSTNDFFLIHEA